MHVMDERRKIIAMISIFWISFIAVSFPSRIRKPIILFFIGKHFGTGVILYTAFSHLLQDAFTSLKAVHLAHRTGLIVLSSLLSIFLIEYISTAYVERLHADPPPVTERTPLIPACTCEAPNGRPGLEPEAGEVRIRRRRQLVGILVLQLGIMIHSFVIGLTLAITGSGFAPLATAIICHQLFEGLSLGIRVAALPDAPTPPSSPLPSAAPRPNANADHAPLAPCDSLDERAGERDLVVHHVHAAPQGAPAPSALERGYGCWKASADAGNAASARAWRWAWPRFGPRVRADSPQHAKRRGPRRPSWRARADLKTALALLFAATTPLGILAGLLWRRGAGAGPDHGLLLARGVLSAASAGLLIYAGTVEMLAGDFVSERGRALARSGPGMQALALGSLLGGVVGAGLVG